ncbi:MAG: ATP-dependent Clp protease proteolytic subunit [Bacteroidota bacterium]|nr:ATP-dependent Clp protease proteolytic subunit [Bacteroidota bacterium]
MSKTELIKQLEKEQNTRLITYITGDRQPFATRIAGDVVPLLSKHLEKIGKTKKISLFLYTSGGDMLAPIRIVKIIRNHCDTFEVLVPYKAHSAGTLIALGADKIVMGKLGELTPVDPTTGHPFNPQNPANPQQRLEVSVEDLNSYFLFAKEKAGVKSNQMSDIYKMLVEKLHPLSIGNAYRAYRMAKLLTERLLSLHMDKVKESQKIKKIINEITGDITIHAYPIDRDEAKELGLKIERPKTLIEQLMWTLYEEYAVPMKIGQPFHPNELLAGKDMAEIQNPGAYIESAEVSHHFVFTGKVQKSIRNNQLAIDMNIDSQSWLERQ